MMFALLLIDAVDHNQFLESLITDRDFQSHSVFETKEPLDVVGWKSYIISTVSAVTKRLKKVRLLLVISHKYFNTRN